MIQRKGIRTWIEIDTKALKHNYQVFRNLVGPKCKLMAVAKSNAYGHGLIDYAKEMRKLGADYIGVDSMTEALALRREGIKTPILVLGYTLPEMINQAQLFDIALTISSPDQLAELKNFSKGIKTDDTLNIHIKVDTGMHRQGFYLRDLPAAIDAILKLKHIRIEGVYTHFAAAKNPAFPAETKKQIEEFKRACQIFREKGINPICHAAATSGAIVFPESHFDMVRIGIGLMGLWPSPETRAAFQREITLSPVLTWKTIISETKEVPKGESIGYSFTESLKRDTKIAILPIGYWHGYKWTLSSTAEVLIAGKRCKIFGRVSMDMISVDMTGINAKIGDEVVLLGRSGQEEITVDELALLSNSYNYEFITQLNPLIKRIYI